MKRQNRIVLPSVQGRNVCIGLTVLLCFSTVVQAEGRGDGLRLLDEGEYRSELEEVVGVGGQAEIDTTAHIGLLHGANLDRRPPHVRPRRASLFATTLVRARAMSSISCRVAGGLTTKSHRAL